LASGKYQLALGAPTYPLIVPLDAGGQFKHKGRALRFSGLGSHPLAQDFLQRRRARALQGQRHVGETRGHRRWVSGAINELEPSFGDLDGA
jgi:hypothetical protein